MVRHLPVYCTTASAQARALERSRASGMGGSHGRDQGRCCWYTPSRTVPLHLFIVVQSCSLFLC